MAQSASQSIIASDLILPVINGSALRALAPARVRMTTPVHPLYTQCQSCVLDFQLTSFYLSINESGRKFQPVARPVTKRGTYSTMWWIVLNPMRGNCWSVGRSVGCLVVSHAVDVEQRRDIGHMCIYMVLIDLADSSELNKRERDTLEVISGRKGHDSFRSEAEGQQIDWFEDILWHLWELKGNYGGTREKYQEGNLIPGVCTVNWAFPKNSLFIGLLMSNCGYGNFTFLSVAVKCGSVRISPQSRNK